MATSVFIPNNLRLVTQEILSGSQQQCENESVIAQCLMTVSQAAWCLWCLLAHYYNWCDGTLRWSNSQARTKEMNSSLEWVLMERNSSFLFVSSHHWDVERPHVGELCDLAGDVAPLADCQRGADALRVRSILHVLQTLCPGGWTHQPQENQGRCDYKVLEIRGLQIRYFIPFKDFI